MIVCGIGVSDRGKRAGGELYARKMFVSEYFVDISREIPVRPTQHCPQNETGIGLLGKKREGEYFILVLFKGALKPFCQLGQVL